FFQAEDGIRDRNVTGVQTCALPISFPPEHRSAARGNRWQRVGLTRSATLRPDRPRPLAAPKATASSGVIFHWSFVICIAHCGGRSEERRVGKEWRLW